MNRDFWLGLWQANTIRFHEGAPNAFLQRHVGALALPPNARIFVPLCGKTRDIAWLLAQGYRVAGAELSPIAIGQLFAELGVVPDITEAGAMQRYLADGIEIFVGDLFDLTAAQLGQVDAIWDRAALIALPPPNRVRYAAQLVQLSATAPQLVTCLEYDQDTRDGPPYSVRTEEIHRLYDPHYTVTLLERAVLDGSPATDAVWLLR
ncbi:MAG: thiopurine S-methyltransferase [bacterium]